MLTATISQSDYLAHLRNNSANPAVAAHAERISYMSTKEWEQHRTELLARRRDPARKATVSRIVREINERRD